MVSTIGAVILQDDINSVQAVSVALGMLRPPRLVGIGQTMPFPDH